MAISNQLLTTKVQAPPLPKKHIQRTRLHEALDHGLDPTICLTLISAPAGYGKTTLLNAWIQGRNLPAAWFAVDEGDNDPVRFMLYLISALNRVIPELDISESLLHSTREQEIQENLLIPLINQISQTARQTILVLDDFHCIHSQTVHDRIGYLLENLPPQAHLFIVTRSDPALPITRLRGRGQVNELRLEDLRFRADEAETFLNVLFNMDLTTEDIRILTNRSEGWISGLQMAAVSLQTHENKETFIRNFSGSHHYIMDYLMDEVLRQQSPEVQTFLLNTSILNRICAPLGDKLMESIGETLPPSQQILTELERANLFIIPLDDQREWYRFHRLFSDLLQSRFQPADPDLIPSLHRQACQWFQGKGFIDDAIHHALLVNDPAFAADLIERFSQEVFLRSETMTFLRWVQRLPEVEIQRRSKLQIYRAWALLFHGAPISTLEAQLDEVDEVKGPPGSSLVLQAYLALMRGQTEEGLQLAQDALKVLPEEEIFLRDFATFCISASHISLGDTELGIALLKQTSHESQQKGNLLFAVLLLCKLGELHTRQLRFTDAYDLYQKALKLAVNQHGEYLPIAGPALIGLGNLALEQYKLAEAGQLLQEGIRFAKRWNLISTLGGYLSLALLHEANGNTEGLRATFSMMHDLSQRFDASEYDDLAAEIVEMGIKTRQGDIDSVQKWDALWNLEDAPNDTPKSDININIIRRTYKYQLPILVRLCMARENYKKVHLLLDELSLEAGQANRPFLQIESELLRAKVFLRTGDEPSALAAIQRGLELAEPQDAKRIFLVEGEEILSLLVKVKSKCKAINLCTFIDRILEHVLPPSVDGESPIQGLPEPLSPRELEILRLLPSGLTMEDIASQLIISVNTVRSHLKNIYAKLDVHSRHEAVSRANDLELL